ncbi:hypothetical protein DTO166G4_5943 [Paecilomyces variotii]|nr:hypothetical protein DTO032I3_4868 [Paecilomyces variotii]KAJ9207806.1 hypothetical protein DTO164E3_92 [Paecilomyces variotii]KAJ9212451.1 hypothetical protein DTO166G4_5943 [Paecilomyces variotii]KAJ9227502.1 hypothetical protein DTO169C6_143 [Paecilomyces variotii]KAJ9231865.1 hypothetical protein DTO166G5_6568 [Paecilomyces variotii]
MDEGTRKDTSTQDRVWHLCRVALFRLSESRRFRGLEEKYRGSTLMDRNVLPADVPGDCKVPRAMTSD